MFDDIQLSSIVVAMVRNVPVLIFALLASKHLVRGLTMGAVK